MPELPEFENEMSESSAVLRLARRLGVEWVNISAASARTRQKKYQLTDAFAELNSADTSIVAFGSLARNEFTATSDLDWTLLIDGQAAPEHLEVANSIKDRIEQLGHKPPGREGAFGHLSFSHDVIHQIGGEDDTNTNTTKRVLLLLESCPLGRADAYERVVRNILSRYLKEDRGLWHGSGPHKIPRFLLNDIARYWRTMAVDLAYKQRTRGGVGFALRTIKLRVSRKLIYIAGLLACFTFELDLTEQERREMFSGSNHLPALAHLKSRMEIPPLELLAMTLITRPEFDPQSKDLFNAYDAFLGVLTDDVKRKHLDSLTDEELNGSEIFREARQISYRFKDAVESIFLSQGNSLGHLTVEYGIF